MAEPLGSITSPWSSGRLGRLSRPRLHERIVELLIDHIGTAGLRPGDRLPPERELSAQLGVSRASPAQAVVALEVLGVISVRHGDGALIEATAADHQVIAGAGRGRGVEGDELFHAAITAAGHSALLARLMREISGLIRKTRLESLAQPGRPTVSLAGHRGIAAAVRGQDAEGAARAMREHIGVVSDIALLRDTGEAAGTDD